MLLVCVPEVPERPPRLRQPGLFLLRDLSEAAMHPVTFPTARPSGLTCPLTCGSEVSEVTGASEFRWPRDAREALSRIDAGPDLAASDRYR